MPAVPAHPRTVMPKKADVGIPVPARGQVWRQHDAPRNRHVLVRLVSAGHVTVVRCTPDGTPLPGYKHHDVKRDRFTAHGDHRLIYVKG